MSHRAARKSASSPFARALAALSAWSAFLLLLYTLLGVHWFKPGDFSFRTAMAYHGLLIPTWLLLAFAYSRSLDLSDSRQRTLAALALLACALVGLGGAFIYKEGFTFATFVQVSGLVLAELTVLALLLFALYRVLVLHRKPAHPLAWWTVTLALLAMSLSTPLGHLAGAVLDLGVNFPVLGKLFTALGLASADTVDAYITSHSHEILAAFLAAAFALPLLFASTRLRWADSLRKSGLVLVALATCAQAALYQYCAWFAWEPPTLFEHGPNGLPLDDAVLVVLGIGMLLLLPALFSLEPPQPSGSWALPFMGKVAGLFLLAYTTSVVLLGLYIEFHEQFFGAGEGTAPGVPNDLAYIRAHLLFGFLLLPLLLAALLNADLLSLRTPWSALLAAVVFLAALGVLATFSWTFTLNSFLLQLTFAFSALFLFVYAFLALSSPRHHSSPS